MSAIMKYIPVLLGLLLSLPLQAQEDRRPITIDDFFKIKTVRNLQISPDGEWVAYTVRETDLKKDKTETRIWMIPSDGGEAIPMTAKGYSASRPRWSPDGKYLSFMASKGKKLKRKFGLLIEWAEKRNS